MNTTELKEALQWDLLTLRPTKLLRKHIKSIDDLVEHRYYVRDTQCRPADLDYLIELVLAAIAQKRRFRQLDCLKVLKRIVKRLFLDRPLPKCTTDHIFALYQHYVFSRNAEIQWAVSVMLKGRLLQDAQIQWLTDHFRKSEHLLNRLLRYPEPHPMIQSWAESAFADPTLAERRSELLGLLITDNLPSIALGVEPTIIAWAIYYSRATDPVKSRLLQEALTDENLSEIVKIAKRSNYPEVIEFILKQIENAA